jgi:hypothetical protein
MWTLRVVGFLDIAFALLGVFLIAHSALHMGRIAILHPDHLASSQAPYVVQVYCVDMLVNLLCVIFLILTGLSVIALQRRGWWMSNTVFTFEIAVFLLQVLGTMLLWQRGGTAEQIGHSVGAAAGIGGLGTSFQIITGYPIIALVATNLAYHALKQSGLQPEHSPEP